MQALSSKVRNVRSNVALREVAAEAGLAEVIDALSFKEGKAYLLSALEKIESAKEELAAAPETEVPAETAAEESVEPAVEPLPEIPAEDALPETLEEIEAALARLSEIPEDDLTEADSLAEIRLEALRRKLRHESSEDEGVRADARRGIPDSSLISEGVRKSWEDGNVRAKRLTRNAVECRINGGKPIAYPSLRKAFAELGLPDSKHIRFRVALKQKGSLAFEEGDAVYFFTVIAAE